MMINKTRLTLIISKTSKLKGLSKFWRQKFLFKYLKKDLTHLHIKNPKDILEINKSSPFPRNLKEGKIQGLKGM